MSPLTEFLLARIAEDEAAARAAFSSDGAWYTERVEDRLEWWVSGEFGGIASTGYVGNSDSQPIAEHMARHHPARVLAECEAKRRIVAAVDRALAFDPNHDGLVTFDTIVKALALPYADHEGFRDEWRTMTS